MANVQRLRCQTLLHTLDAVGRRHLIVGSLTAAPQHHRGRMKISAYSARGSRGEYVDNNYTLLRMFSEFEGKCSHEYRCFVVVLDLDAAAAMTPSLSLDHALEDASRAPLSARRQQRRRRRRRRRRSRSRSVRRRRSRRSRRSRSRSVREAQEERRRSGLAGESFANDGARGQAPLPRRVGQPRL